MIKILNPLKKDFSIDEHSFSGIKKSSRHMHKFYEIFIITEGSIYHVLNSKITAVRQGTLGLITPGDEHYFQCAEKKSVKFLNVEFSRELFQKAVSAQAACDIKNEIWNGMTAPLPEYLYRAILAKINFLMYDDHIKSGINRNDILVGLIFDCLACLRNSSAGEHKAPYWLLEACETVKKAGSEKLDIENFTRISGKTQEHLTRSMKRFLNITPSAYLKRIKLGRAANLLRMTDQSVLDIALNCGFGNVSGFNKLFRQEFGMTPTKLRSTILQM